MSACLLVPCRVLNTPGLLLWSKIISRRNCRKTLKTAIKPLTFTSAQAQVCCHGAPSLSCSGQVTDNPVSLALEGLPGHRVACVLAQRPLLAGLPGCLGLRCAREEHGFWRHPVDRHRQNTYCVPGTVSGNDTEIQWVKPTSHQTIINQTGMHSAAGAWPWSSVCPAVLEGFLEEVMSERRSESWI